MRASARRLPCVFLVGTEKMADDLCYNALRMPSETPVVLCNKVGADTIASAGSFACLKKNAGSECAGEAREGYCCTSVRVEGRE